MGEQQHGNDDLGGQQGGGLFIEAGTARVREPGQPWPVQVRQQRRRSSAGEAAGSGGQVPEPVQHRGGLGSEDGKTG